MKSFIFLLFIGLLLASCNGDNGNINTSEAQVDSIVNAKVDVLRAEMKAKNDSIINAMAKVKADSILTSMHK